MTTITRTVYGSAIQTAQYFGKSHTILPNTTLNEKFNILPSTYPNADEIPVVQYLTIGDKGHTGTMGANGRFKTRDVKHRRTDAACFNHIPFAIRPISSDLTVEERRKYRLRSVVTIDSQLYVAYYGRLLDYSNSAVNMQITDVVNSTTVPFIPTANELNPTIPESFEATNQRITTSMVVPIEFTANDVSELRNVARVLYGNEDEAIVSEFALCSGVDRVSTGQGGGNTQVTYTEVIGTQITLHITSYYAADQHNDGFSLIIDGGVAEALDVMS